MSKASGILLIAVGVGVAAYAMPFDNERSEASYQNVSVEHVAKTEAAGSATSIAMTAPKPLLDIESPTPVVKPTPISAETKNVAPGKSTVVAILPRAVDKPALVE